jgi:hypothetical protein
MKDEKKLKKLAEELYKLERECQLGNNTQENMNKMEQLIQSLSVEEMLIIDTYITEQNFLTK